MVDVASIIIAVIALAGSLVSAGLTAYVTYYIDRIKRIRETRALTDKYRDPLALSAYDLQSRFYNLLDQGVLSYLSDDEPRSTKVDLVRIYTAFLIGQYFSWVFIFRREARFLRFATDAANQEMNRIMEEIVRVFGTDEFPGEGAFMLWRGQQMAIGELMTERDLSGQLYCIGYAAFASKYEEDPTFRRWFFPIEDGITDIAEARASRNTLAANRLRRLQHMLVDLVILLGSDVLTQEPYKSGKAVAAPDCKCKKCWDRPAKVARSRWSTTKAKERRRA